MRLATIKDGTRDGRLHLVSRDHSRCAPATAVQTLQSALEQWEEVVGHLQAEAEALEAGGGIAFNVESAMAPLPRAWQWLDGSAFESHGDLMDQVFGMEKQDRQGRPLMYQGLSDRFLGPRDDVPMVSEDDFIDFEGEFGVITGDVPINADITMARERIRLVVQINDWSLRRIAPIEMRTGFGWVQAKPACSVAPVAVTPDELGPYWRDARVDLPLRVEWNGQAFGEASGYEMGVGFDELVAHAAYSRSLPAGTVIGSGTVSNRNFREIGSSCIAERRGIEIVDEGKARTPYMRFGERVAMECRLPSGAPLFGRIDQRVVRV